MTSQHAERRLRAAGDQSSPAAAGEAASALSPQDKPRVASRARLGGLGLS
ncbi:hypothetical protein [Nonomuraea indica]|uniref:Uncharacterized protein n=1 Tax=Nonomuraea indica TaxID=1581193 RepID=A0ABW7ZXT5_9ACTN